MPEKKPSEKDPHIPYSLEFGAYLKQKRVTAELTQLELATKLGFPSSMMVSKWERGLLAPPAWALFKSRAILDISTDELIKVLTKTIGLEYVEYFSKKKVPRKRKF